MINPRARIDLAYVGTAFHGWQIQPALRTVQGELTAMLSRLLDRPCQAAGAGRTDTGVHARGQVAHAELRNDAEVARVCGALAKLAPDDMHILAVREVSPAFDARFSATARRYSYRLRWSRNIFDPHAFEVFRTMDRMAMDAACRRILGTHDFASMCKTGSLKDDNTCCVDLCALEWGDEGCIFNIRANRFLHHMVRNLVALLLEVGQGLRQPEDIDAVLAARDRSAAGKMAPARGLYLEEVSYPEPLLDPGYLPPDFIPRPGSTTGSNAASEGDEA